MTLAVVAIDRRRAAAAGVIDAEGELHAGRKGDALADLPGHEKDGVAPVRQGLRRRSHFRDRWQGRRGQRPPRRRRSGEAGRLGPHRRRRDALLRPLAAHDPLPRRSRHHVGGQLERLRLCQPPVARPILLVLHAPAIRRQAQPIPVEAVVLPNRAAQLLADRRPRHPGLPPLGERDDALVDGHLSPIFHRWLSTSGKKSSAVIAPSVALLICAIGRAPG